MNRAHLAASRHEDSSTSQTPIVTTFLALDVAGGSADGLLGGTFQGFNPPVTGGLTVALGATAYELPGTDSRAAALQHVIDGAPVADPTVLVDLNFATPAHGPDSGISTDIGIASTTLGFSSLVTPLQAALQGTTLGNELQPLLGLSSALLPGYGKHGGVPKGGITDAKPMFAASAGIGISQTLTTLGVTTTSSAGGSLTLSRALLGAVVNTVTGAATLFSDTGTLVSDVLSGNLVGAVTEGVVTLGDGVALAGDVGGLISAAAHQPPPHLPVLKNPALSLDVNVQDAQNFALGLGTPTQVDEALNVQITADNLGAYALGKLLALYAPELIADLSGGTTQTAENLFAQLAQGAAALASGAVNGVEGGSTPGVQSSANAPDIGIAATLVTTEHNNTLLGNATNSQTFTLNFETNAQGLYDLGTAAQSVIIPVLVGLLETPGGQEALQIGGEILQQIDSNFGGARHDPMLAPTHMAHLL